MAPSELSAQAQAQAHDTTNFHGSLRKQHKPVLVLVLVLVLLRSSRNEERGSESRHVRFRPLSSVVVLQAAVPWGCCWKGGISSFCLNSACAVAAVRLPAYAAYVPDCLSGAPSGDPPLARSPAMRIGSVGPLPCWRHAVQRPRAAFPPAEVHCIPRGCHLTLRHAPESPPPTPPHPPDIADRPTNQQPPTSSPLCNLLIPICSRPPHAVFSCNHLPTVTSLARRRSQSASESRVVRHRHTRPLQAPGTASGHSHSSQPLKSRP